MSAYTSAPWTVVRRRDGLAIAPVGLVLLGAHDERHEADVALAAAAPELLEALECLLNTPPGHSEERNRAIAKAEIAASKARGER